MMDDPVSEIEGRRKKSNGHHDSQLDWAVIKSLMSAQENTTASLERYLLYVTHDDFELDKEHVEWCLSQAIDNHERALEDLKVAREIVSERE